MRFPRVHYMAVGETIVTTIIVGKRYQVVIPGPTELFAATLNRYIVRMGLFHRRFLCL